jgi:hypothetical protein
VTGQPGLAGLQAGFPPPPPALAAAARRPRAGGSTLVLRAGGQNVIVVLGENGGEAQLMWSFIQRFLAGGKPVRM